MPKLKLPSGVNNYYVRKNINGKKITLKGVNATVVSEIPKNQKKQILKFATREKT